MKCLPGDIVLTKSKEWYGWLIRWGNQYTGEEKTVCNHVGVGEDKVYFIEALWTTVRTMWANLQYEPKDTWEVWRHKSLTDEQRIAVAEKAREYLGRKYGWWKIGLHGIDGILGKIFCTDVYLFRRIGFMDKYPICSWLAAFAYKKAIGYEFGVDPERAAPDDIRDWVSTHGDWEKIC